MASNNDDPGSQLPINNNNAETESVEFAQNLETLQADNGQQEQTVPDNDEKVAPSEGAREGTENPAEQQEQQQPEESKEEHVQDSSGAVAGQQEDSQKQNDELAEVALPAGEEEATKITQPSNIVIQERSSRLEQEGQEEAAPADAQQTNEQNIDQEVVKPQKGEDKAEANVVGESEVQETAVTRPILSQDSTIDEVIEQQLPQLKAKLGSDSQAGLHDMVRVLEEKQDVFEQAFISVKQEQAEGAGKDERIDMVLASHLDNIIMYLTINLPMDLTDFHDYFRANHGQIIDRTTKSTITLGQLVQTYLEYIEHQHHQTTSVQPEKVNNSDTGASPDSGNFIFGENFYILRHDLISEKLTQCSGQIDRILVDVGEEDGEEGEQKLPLGRLREFWLQLTLVTRSVMVKRGTEYRLGERVMDDPSCLDLLQKHVLQAYNKPAMTDAEFENAISSDPLQFDDKLVSKEFLLREMQEFFHENRQVILVDLDELETQKPTKDQNENQIIDVEQEAHVSKQENEPLNLDLQAENISLEQDNNEASKPSVNKTSVASRKPVKSKKPPTVPVDPFGERAPRQSEEPSQPKYTEKDPNYVVPPSELPDDRQKIIENNLLEVFNFYCRKFAAVRGDFTQKNQNLIVLGLQGFTRFSKDFKVPLTTAELTTVWKKSSNNHQPHDFEQFHKSIGLLGQTVNRAKQEKLTVRSKQLKKELRKRKDALTGNKDAVGLEGASASQERPQGAVQVKPLKTSLAKMSDAEIQGELILLPQQIGRVSIFSEDQSRVQMYELLEIEYPDRYRPKLPTAGQNELNSNILQTKKLISGDLASQAGGSKASQGAVSTVIARLTSNPPTRDRAAQIIERNRFGAKEAFVKDMRSNRGKTQARPQSLLSPAPSAQNLQTNKRSSQADPLIPVSPHSQKTSIGPTNSVAKDAGAGVGAKSALPSNIISGGAAFQRKKTEVLKQGQAMHGRSSAVTLESPNEPLTKKIQEVVDSSNQLLIKPSPARQKKKATVPTSPTQKERGDLAEIHKRIRLEKQNTGRVISVAEAKKRIEEDKKGFNRKSSIASLKSKGTAGREKLTPSKMIPLSQINQGKRQQNHFVIKTPSMIDLNAGSAQKTADYDRQKMMVPAQLTFDDIQKMHLTSLNRFGGQEDEFRPQDFLDLDSQDSDNEILAKFKPEVVLPDGIHSKPVGQNEMLSLLHPSSPLKHKQYAPPYIATNNMIDEQTGYSNSPKFSIYRLNNQSNLKNGDATSVYEDQMLTGNIQAPNQHEQSRLYNEDFFPPDHRDVKTDGTKNTFGAQQARLGQNKPTNAVRQSSKNLAATRASTKPLAGKGAHAVPITTPQSRKGKAGGIKGNHQLGPSGRHSKMSVGGPGAASGATSRVNEGGGHAIFESHGQLLPFADQHQPYMDIDFTQDGKATPTPPPHLIMNENLSEIGLSNNIHLQRNGDQITSLGEISMFNDGSASGGQNVSLIGGSQLKPPGSPPRRPAQQIIDDQRSVLSKQNSGAHIGEGLNAKPPNLPNDGRQKLKVGSARIQSQQDLASGKATVSGSQQQPKRRLGQIAQGKRSQSKPAGAHPNQHLGQVAPGPTQPRYTTSSKKEQNGAAGLRVSRDSQVAGLPVSNSAALGPDALSMNAASDDQTSNRLLMRQASQALAQGHQAPKSLLPPQLSREGNDGSRQVAKSNSAVSSSNQRSLMRAQEAQKREIQNKQRRMDGLLNLHEQNIKKGLSAVSRR